MDRSTSILEQLRPAGGKRSSKRDRILNVFLRQEGHLSADDLVDLVRREDHAHRPRHRLPHAAVDGRRRHRPQGRLRRGALPVRALVPPSAPLSPDLQDLPPLVRVPELRHRGADRGGRRGAQLHRARRACVQIYGDVRGLPHRARAARSTARRPSWCSRATRCASRSRPSAAASSSTRAPRALTTRRRAAGAVFQKLAEEEKEHLAHARERATASCSQQDPQLESRPTFLFFKGAANGLFAEGAEQLCAAA